MMILKKMWMMLNRLIYRDYFKEMKKQMFNFKQALLYKIEKKGKYESQFINTYDN
jgi:hypothetical protein